jgi:hypothetical protein
MSETPGLIHADSDKPHRCPACWSVTEDKVALLRIMRCECGQRFAIRPWLPYADEDRQHPAVHMARAATKWLRDRHDDAGIYGWREAARIFAVRAVCGSREALAFCANWARRAEM